MYIEVLTATETHHILGNSSELFPWQPWLGLCTKVKFHSTRRLSKVNHEGTLPYRTSETTKALKRSLVAKL